MQNKGHGEGLLKIMQERMNMASASSGSGGQLGEQAAHHVQERTKELTCLYRSLRLLGDTDRPFSDVLQDVADLLPEAWQYPEITHGRISCLDVVAESPGFNEGEWKQSAQIVLESNVIGSVDVFYCEEMGASDAGPFLAEERLLIDAIAENIARTLTGTRALQALDERVKELGCLYGVSELVDRFDKDIPAILRGVTDILPSSWQHPDSACARIILGHDDYRTDNYKESRWSQAATIKVDEETAGLIQVAYLEEMPESDDGPFLKEEQLLLNAISERLGKVVRRSRAEKQLEAERESLHNMNIAMKEVLRQVQDEKKRLAAQIQSNVDQVVMPILQACERISPSDHAVYIALIRRNLEDIVAPYQSRLSDKFGSLSPTEIQICNMVKNGLSTKDIAEIRRISPATVSRHREHIRRKLGIANTTTNLVTFLAAFGADRPE